MAGSFTFWGSHSAQGKLRLISTLDFDLVCSTCGHEVVHRFYRPLPLHTMSRRVLEHSFTEARAAITTECPQCASKLGGQHASSARALLPLVDGTARLSRSAADAPLMVSFSTATYDPQVVPENEGDRPLSDLVSSPDGYPVFPKATLRGAAVGASVVVSSGTSFTVGVRSEVDPTANVWGSIEHWAPGRSLKAEGNAVDVALDWAVQTFEQTGVRFAEQPGGWLDALTSPTGIVSSDVFSAPRAVAYAEATGIPVELAARLSAEFIISRLLGTKSYQCDPFSS